MDETLKLVVDWYKQPVHLLWNIWNLREIISLDSLLKGVHGLCGFGLQAVEIECEFKSPVDEVKSAGPTNLSIGHILNDVRLLGSWFFY